MDLSSKKYSREVSRDYSALSESFYKPEDESQIREEVDQRDRAADLSREIKQRKLELQVLEDRKIEKRIHEITDQQNKLKTRLQELETAPPPEDDTEKKFEAIDVRKRIQEIEKKEKEKEAELIERRKLQEMEKMVRKKIELEKIQDQQKQLQDQYKRTANQIDAINEERESRSIKHLALLDKALNRANVIQHSIKNGALSEKDKRLFADNIVEQGIESKKENDRILSEIMAHRFQEAHKASIDTKEQIRNFNNITAALNDKHEELLKKKAVHASLQSKGIDYMAQFEMGNTPPLELISKNMKVDPEEHRRQVDLQEILRKGKDYIEEAQDKIRQTIEEQEEIREFFARDPEYQGELKPFLEQCSPLSLNMARWVLELIFGRAMEEIMLTENLLKQARVQSKHLEVQARKANRKQKQIAQISAMREIGLELLDEVVDSMAREIAKEMHKINDNARTMSVMVVMRALRIERNFNQTDNELQKQFFDMRGLEKKKKKNKFKFYFKDVQDIKEKDVKATLRSKLGGAGKGMLDLLNQNDKQPLKDAEYGAEELDPEQCVENMGEFSIRKFELDYWDQMSLEVEQCGKCEWFKKS